MSPEIPETRGGSVAWPSSELLLAVQAVAPGGCQGGQAAWQAGEQDHPTDGPPPDSAACA